MARCIFHIDLDAFFVSVEQALEPKLKGKPVIVGGDPERRGVVASASYEARPFGIHAGMSLSRARRLCPQAIFLQADFPRYRDASAKFMRILANFSPHIEPLGLDEAYLDVTGFEQPYKSPQQLALSMKDRIYKEVKLTASIGIATCKVVAKIASDLCKPNGLLEIAPEGERDFLRPLPVAKLPGVGRKTEEILKQMGITTIGELASLPQETVKSRLGVSGVAIHRYANGIDDRKVEAPGEPKSISQQTTFAKDTLDRHFLEAELPHLCEQVTMELRSQAKQARCITIRLRYADFKTITRQTTLKEVTNVNQVIFAAAFQLLNKALTEKEKAIRLIGIKASTLVGKERQLSMFDPRGERAEHLDKAIDQIKTKYGLTSIKRGGTIANLG
jgi:DNA polymerase-4